MKTIGKTASKTARSEDAKHVTERITTASIGKRLSIRQQTVETHRHNLMQKFQSGNSALLKKTASLVALNKHPGNQSNYRGA
ncbi:LuxR C-terminal-related transcriptional regulator [Mucilaginibacter sp. SP1R1]|uniref:LuxR C-terminal-related transcriptional regulator n=1 Tax=Mucilaginibacter sp. SP1R1 TaxID=2723091 RepID=UPI001608A819|nr:LuxR C-terminal-related transcriptional regulator [Mucilaginibacter sp. SP1R1]